METIRKVSREVADAMAERLEYELRGAWRAGYDYVHVYRPLPETTGFNDGDPGHFTLRQYVLPSYTKERPEPDGVRYLHTYDLNSVPDDVLRKAVRGGLDSGDLEYRCRNCGEEFETREDRQEHCLSDMLGGGDCSSPGE